MRKRAVLSVSCVTFYCVPSADKQFLTHSQPYGRVLPSTHSFSQNYFLDYLAVRCDDRHDIYIVERDIFFKTYEKKQELYAAGAR